MSFFKELRTFLRNYRTQEQKTNYITAQKHNVKPIEETVLFMVWYIGVRNMPTQRAKQEVADCIKLFSISDEEKRKMGYKHVYEQFVPCEGNTYLEITFG